MATVSAKVFPHHKKTDGTCNVKICVHHKDQRRYLDTNHYVVKKQLSTDFKIKDRFILDLVDEQLRDYRKTISEVNDRLDFFSVDSLRDYLANKDSEVDFYSSVTAILRDYGKWDGMVQLITIVPF